MTRASLPSLRAAVVLASLFLAAPSVRAAPTAFEVDPVHSTLLFRIQHLGVSWTYGRFNEFEGKLVVDDAEPSRSSVEITAQIASVDTGNEKRDQHLKSPDFFNAAQFPTMTFRSTAVAARAAGFDVTGDLTLHGVTKSVTVQMVKVGEAQDPRAGHRIGFEGHLVIKRSDFGMTNMLGGVGDDVHVTIAVEGVDQ